ncbi:MAG: ABC transporter permease [Opitutales bacterium]|nr:ABC transporter permease [Opitutales bacterium]
MPWYFYLAVKQLFPSGRKLPSFFFVVSVLGVALGVAVLIGVQSVMGGFDQTYKDKMVQTTGHIEIRNGGSLIYDVKEVLEVLDADPRVEAAVPAAHGVVMLQYRNRPSFPMIRGIDVNREHQVYPMDQFLIEGTIDDLDDDSIFLSSGLAYSIGARVGSVIELYTPLMIEGLKSDEVILPREFVVTGIYQTGWNQLDESTIICTLRTMQDLYGLGRSVHSIAVKLKDGVDELAYADELNSGKLPFPQYAYTWIDLNSDFLWVLALEKNMMLFLMLFIVVVAAFSISIAQLLTVIRKTREIGVIGAIGGSGRAMAVCYCFQGFFIGLLGVACGIALAVTVLHFRDPIVGGLASITQTKETLVKFYQFSNLPVYYSKSDFIVVTVSTLFLSTLAGFIPAFRAARMKPADALRSE